MKYPKPVVGQKVWLRHSKYYSRDSVSLIECTVTKVGNKYFEIDGAGYKTRFFNDSWLQDTEYTHQYILYQSKELYELGIDTNAAIKSIEAKLKHMVVHKTQANLIKLQIVDKILTGVISVTNASSL